MVSPSAFLRCAIILAWLIGSAFAQESGNVDCEIRVVWGGPQNRPFQGQISIERGNLRPTRNLSLQPDSVGAIRSLDTATVELLPHSFSQFGGVDLHVHGELSSPLLFRFEDPYTSNVVEHRVELREILQGNWMESLDEHGTRIAIERQMHDRVRVDLNVPASIYDVDQDMKVRIGGYRAGVAAGSYVLSAKILKDGQTVGIPFSTSVQVDQNGSFSRVEWETQAPSQEGAYAIELSLTRRSFLNNLVSTSAAVVRRVDFVVLDANQRTPQISGWRPLLSIDMLEASKPGSLAWLAPLTELSSYVGLTDKWQQYSLFPIASKPSISEGQLASREFLSTDSAEPKQCLTIASEGWIALPLTDLKAGVPHRLRVRTPTDQPMQLAVTVRTPDVDGELPAVSADSAIVINSRECAQDGSLAIHDTTFWPKEGGCYLLFANTHETDVASIASVEVEVAELSQAQAAEFEELPHRMVGLYLEKPLIANSFSVASERDPVTGRQLNGWASWYDASERLEQYMHWVDADTLLLKVLAEGGAVFPSSRLEPSRRFDSGAFFTDSRSPEIKDYVELLLRRLDREGKHLVLALDFDGPLPGLSRWSEREPAVLQRNLAGAAWPASKGSQRRIERYNPLDSRVQSELLSAIREIIDRYADHPSFAGISLQLDQGSQFVFAGDRWGFDEETLARFAEASQVRLPERERLEQVFSGPTRLAFIDWRAKEMTKLYTEISAALKRRKPNAKLYINAVRLWEKRPSAEDFADPEGIIRNPSEYLMAYGIDPEGIAAVEGVMLMHGRLNRFWESSNSKDWVLGLSSMRALQSVAAENTAAVIVQHPSSFQLKSLEKIGGVARNPSSQWVFPHASGYGHYARKELVEQLYSADPLLLASGGWLPVPGQEEPVKSLFRTLRDFPPVALAAAIPADPQSNLRIRSGVYQGRTYIQLVNSAPWAESVRLRVRSSSANPQVRPLGDRDPSILVKNANTWEIRLPPIDVVGIEVADDSLEIVGLEHAPSSQAVQRIASELQGIEAIIAEAGDPTQRLQLADLAGTFENWSSEEKPVGWNVSSLPNVDIYRSNEFPHRGRSSLVIENRNARDVSAWIQSRRFNPPSTGRLAVQAWLRAPAAGDPMKVRLSVVGRLSSGERFERSHVYGNGDLESMIPNDWGRRPASLFVADIPADELTELSVAIDLIGPGKVWIDDVEVFELRLHPDERVYLRGQVLVAKQKLAENNPFPAERLLDSNWGHYLSEFSSTSAQSDRMVDRAALQTREESLRTRNGEQAPKPIFQQWRESIRGRWRR